MTKDEALKKAFKQAFQLGQDYWYQADHEYESQNKKSDVTRAKFEQLMEDAIKEALAQPEQEPVAYINVEQRKLEWAKYMTWDTPTVVNLPKIPLYTTPPQRKPLTDEEILADETLRYYFGLNGGAGPVSKQGRRIVNAIEASHGIKGEA